MGQNPNAAHSTTLQPLSVEELTAGLRTIEKNSEVQQALFTEFSNTSNLRMTALEGAIQEVLGTMRAQLAASTAAAQPAAATVNNELVNRIDAALNSVSARLDALEKSQAQPAAATAQPAAATAQPATATQPQATTGTQVVTGTQPAPGTTVGNVHYLSTTEKIGARIMGEPVRFTFWDGLKFGLTVTTGAAAGGMIAGFGMETGAKAADWIFGGGNNQQNAGEGNGENVTPMRRRTA